MSYLSRVPKAHRSPAARAPFEGREAVVATQHGKEQSLRLPLTRLLGVVLVLPGSLDTDRLGTFTGEVERPGPPGEVVIRKAQLGCEASGRTLGFASEGTFGPHPSVPFAVAHHELLACVDLDLGIEVVEPAVTLDTNFASTTVRRLDEIHARPHGRPSFLERARYPSHGLIVMPADGGRPIAKAVTDDAMLALAVERAAASSADGLARVETDMRAHLNPTRRRVIRRLGAAIACRLLSPCPACGTRGWGEVDVRHGLPCEACGTPTELVRAHLLGCVRCEHRVEVPRRDGLSAAGQRDCPFCNP